MIRRLFAVALLCLTLSEAAAAQQYAPGFAPPPGPQDDPPGLLPENPELTGAQIVTRAYEAAGGDAWVRPKTLYLRGYGVFYRGAAAQIHERHEMWRRYPDTKNAAHAADGKVRIDSYRDGRIVSQLGFDGSQSWTQAGVQQPSAADQQWAENFGFGVIRYALSPGYRVERLMDDLVDGQACHVIKVIDPANAETLFCIGVIDSAILRVGFNTPRGWHERIYSDFLTKPGVRWVQPGRVRLYYNGVKQNEIIWTDFEVDLAIPDAVFSFPGRAP